MVPSKKQVDPVAELYRQTGVTPPSAARPIAPLGELIGSFNLIQVELAGLTGQAAGQYLALNSGPVSQLKNATDEPLAGFLYATSRHAVLFVEQTHLLPRRRFSAGHELGHYWLHYLKCSSQHASPETDTEPIIFIDAASSIATEDVETTEFANEVTKVKVDLPLNRQQMEHEADLFASRLLMPAALIKTLTARYSPGFAGENLVRRLANELMVSRQAIRIRLRDLGLFS